MHAPAKRVHHLWLFVFTVALDRSPTSPAFCITHRVSLLDQRGQRAAARLDRAGSALTR
jgi:hypothetical protein